MRYSPSRSHEDTLQWANEIENGLAEEINGIKGRSVLFDIPEFDIIHDVPPEPMHLIDGGFTKGLMARMFNVGTSNLHHPGYRRDNTVKLSEFLL